MSLYVHSLVLAGLLFFSTAVLADLETGLVQLTGSGDECSDSVLFFSCITTGRGATELTLDSSDTPLFEFPHGQYEDGADVIETRLSGDITAGNLSRSTDLECFDTLNNVMDYCYTTKIVVLLTERTRCRTIRCRTRVRTTMDELMEFGNSSLTRIPPAPTNLRVVNQSMEAATFTWDTGSVSCSNALYDVATMNCGNCNQNISTSNNDITCEGLNRGKECRVSVRSSLECGAFSDSATNTYKVPPSTTTAANSVETSNSEALVGGVIGGVLGGVVITITVAILIVIIVVVCRRRRIKSENLHTDNAGNRRSEAEKEQETMHVPPDKKEGSTTPEGPQETENIPLDNHVVDENVTEDHTVATNGELVSPADQSVISETKETIPLLPFNGSSSTAAAIAVSQPSTCTADIPQSQEELERPKETVHVQQAMVIAGYQTTAVSGNGALSYRDETPPAVSTSRGMEHNIVGMVHPVVPFNKPMEPPEEGRLEQSMAENKNRDDVPVGNQNYNLSDGGKLLTQVASRSNSGNQVASQPVESSGPSQTVGISNNSGGPKLSSTTKSVSEDHGERLKNIEKVLCEQGGKIDLQGDMIYKLQSEVFELNKTIREMREQYDELLQRSSNKQEQLLEEIQSLKEKLEAKEAELKSKEVQLKSAFARIEQLENQGSRCQSIKKQYRRYDSTPA